ncbi:DddA-like double-stranded DNA deaminase toxin [Lentzea albidocapillata]|nr:DddA-like double-stranded DNA deaminase toxin [Lentzea albidocapillata]
MASFEEVSAELNRVVDQVCRWQRPWSRRDNSLTRPRSAVRQWSDVTTRAAELTQALTVVRRGVESYHKTLQGDRASPNLPSPTAPAGSTPAFPQTTWIERQRAQLPAYVTSGFHRDEERHGDLVQSGAEPNGEDRAIAQHLVAIGRVRPRTFPTAAQHVETKVGWRMRMSGVRRAEVVVNNRLCEGPLSCFELLPLLLLPGQTLVVHDPVRSHTFQGKGTR